MHFNGRNWVMGHNCASPSLPLSYYLVFALTDRWRWDSSWFVWPTFHCSSLISAVEKKSVCLFAFDYPFLYSRSRELSVFFIVFGPEGVKCSILGAHRQEHFRKCIETPPTSKLIWGFLNTSLALVSLFFLVRFKCACFQLCNSGPLSWNVLAHSSNV